MLPSLVILLSLSSFPTLVAILPDTLDDYKMIIAFGKPLKASGSRTLTLAWVDCVQECWNDTSCVMAYEGSKCQLYTVANISTIQKLSNGSRVAFRVKSTDCPALGASPLLNGAVMEGDTEGSTLFGYFTTFITFNITLTANIWSVLSAEPLHCVSTMTFVQRDKGVWCIGLFLWTSCLNQTNASSMCTQRFNGGRLSGIENEQEFEYIRESAMAYLPSTIQSVKYNQLGFWVDGTRKSTCQYPPSATCNGTNEFTFSDAMMSSPGGYEWLAGQPDGMSNTSANSNCLYFKTQTTGGTGIDDTPCSMDKTSGMCYAGFLCGMQPSVSYPFVQN